MRLVLRVLKALLCNVRGRALALLLAFFLLYRIRVSKGLNFPDGLFSRIFDHNIYQRCAASPQELHSQFLQSKTYRKQLASLQKKETVLLFV